MNMPTPTPPQDSPAYWRRRAEEARRAAEQMVDRVSKRTLLDIAEAYEKLAKETSAAKTDPDRT